MSKPSHRSIRKEYRIFAVARKYKGGTTSSIEVTSEVRCFSKREALENFRRYLSKKNWLVRCCYFVRYKPRLSERTPAVEAFLEAKRKAALELFA